MNIQQWYKTGDWFDHEGHRIFYRVEGEGQPLLLIHGYPTASWDWNKIWQPLAQRFQCIALDMLGFGYSDKPQQPYRISQQADIHCALINKLALDTCHVVSHDYGDTVAQELLARQNEGELNFRLSSLVLLNGGLFPEAHHPVLTQKLLLGPMGGLLARMMSRQTLAKNLKKIFGPDTQPDEREIDEFWQLICQNEGKRVMHRLIHYMVERRTNRERWVGALQETCIPLRLIDGMADPISGAHMVKRYEQLVPNADVVRLENVGHYPQVEAPQQVLAAILEKIARSND